MKRILVTGAAGFIGAALCLELIKKGYQILGVDNLNNYYDVQLKLDRLHRLDNNDLFLFKRVDISDKSSLQISFEEFRPEIVVNLAAQAGVRYSILNPDSYTKSNLVGFANILECCRGSKVEHLIFASSSSVYGKNKKIPFSEEDNVDRPVSYYAATKKANELMAAAYSELYRIRTTGLRFFTVYGPWGRPDMAPWLFTRAILEDRAIKVFNHGKMRRDFTYIDDIVSGVIGVIELKNLSGELFNIYNIGNNEPEELGYFIEILEKECGKSANKEYLPMQMGDVPVTYADISKLSAVTGFRPQVSLEEGLQKFVSWFKEYHGLN